MFDNTHNDNPANAVCAADRKSWSLLLKSGQWVLEGNENSALHKTNEVWAKEQSTEIQKGQAKPLTGVVPLHTVYTDGIKCPSQVSVQRP